MSDRSAAPLLENRCAVVTGCSRGIGRAILELFAREGADVWACTRSRTEEFEAYAGELARRCGVRVTPVPFDLAEPEQVKSAMTSILAGRGRVDILVNDAGVVPEKRLFQMAPIEEMRRTFEVNFFGTMLVTQYVSRHMAKRGTGSIVNIASVAGLDGDPAELDYVASKAAMIGATKKLAIELGAHGIRVNAVAPGLTDTEMARGMRAELMQATVDRTIMRRLGRPEEIAAATLFLASSMSSFVTGQVLRVDGGMKGA